jgi:hypothetical protein
VRAEVSLSSRLWATRTSGDGELKGAETVSHTP